MDQQSEIQDRQYKFPYHYIPSVDGKNATIYRSLYWGFAYLARNEYIMRQACQTPPQSILDLGCGDGALLHAMSKDPRFKGVQLTGIDMSSRAISLAEAINPDLDFRVADIAQLSETFDCIVCNQVLEHIPDDGLNAFLQGAARALNPNGLFILTLPTKLLPVEKKHYRHYDLQMLKDEIRDAGCDLELVSHEYLLNQRGWYKAYLKMTSNHLFYLRVPAFDRGFWNFCKKRVVTKEGKGTNLAACFKKA